MCHHATHDELRDLSEADREELLDAHDREELEAELFADELEALELEA